MMYSQLQVEPGQHLKSLFLRFNYQNKWDFPISLVVLKSIVQQAWEYNSSATSFCNCFSHWIVPAKPMGCFGGELYSVGVKMAWSVWSVPQFAEQTRQKHIWNFTAVGPKRINIKAGAKSSRKSILPACPSWAAAEQTSSRHHQGLGFSSSYVIS